MRTFLIAATPEDARQYAECNPLEHGEYELVTSATDFWNTCRPHVIFIGMYDTHPKLDEIRDELRTRMARVEYAEVV